MSDIPQKLKELMANIMIKCHIQYEDVLITEDDICNFANVTPWVYRNIIKWWFWIEFERDIYHAFQNIDLDKLIKAKIRGNI